MKHFLYLIGFAFFVAVVFGAFFDGDTKKKVLHGVRVFVEFTGVALLLAWIFYFLPW